MRTVATFVMLAMATATILSGCDQHVEKSQVVQSTAYTLAESETKKGNVGLAAWGDQLEPGMKAIAVSRDLIKAGLVHNTTVTIEGLPGDYKVLDKMNKRWTNKIDILMADPKRAREWGKKDVTIHWQESAP
ncbi:MAG: hypothetical protein R3292_10355 [Alcanivorax sp.]|nr:hypothetical protein [Alcanivorax sp.]